MMMFTTQKMGFLITTGFIVCVHYLCLIARVYVFYVGYLDKSSLYETLFRCNIPSKHHHHHTTRHYMIDVFFQLYFVMKYFSDFIFTLFLNANILCEC
jgi:hypothetical protein